MYASVRLSRGLPGSAHEVVQRIQQDFVPLLSKIPGFVSYYAVVTGGDTITGISIFEDQAGAEESGRLAVQWVRENISPLMAAPLEVRSGEVAVHVGK